MNDFIYALRQLSRRPAHTLVVVTCLAAGLIVSIAAFSILTSLALGDQPGIQDQGALVRAYLIYDAAQGQRETTYPSLDDFDGLRGPGPALGSLEAEGTLGVAAVGRHGAIGLSGAFVSGNYFAALGTLPRTGRLLVPEDERADAPPVVVVSDHFWRTQLDSAPDSLGSAILLGGHSFTVVGVAPPRFHGLNAIEIGDAESKGLQIWIPLQHARLWPGAPSSSVPWLTAIGRLRPGSTVDEAQSQIALRAAQLVRANATALVRLHGFAVSGAPLEIIAVISALLCIPLTVLAIACSNVANLQLARAADRARELAVRLALGASRGRLIRLLTIETSILVASALAVAGVATVAILRFVEPYFPVQLSIEWRGAVFSIALMLAVSVATGLAPAWHVMRGFDSARLKETGQGGGVGHSRLRSSLVVAQVALSLVTLSASLIFQNSVTSMQMEVPSALKSQLVVEFDPAQSGGPPAETSRFAAALDQRIQADPRVQAVSLSRTRRIRYSTSGGETSRGRDVSLVEITPAWLSVMDVPVLKGRPFTDTDRSGGSGIALISARLADAIAPSESPLGKALYIRDGASERSVEIVGVVADNRTQPMWGGDRPDPVVYMPLPMAVDTPFTVRIRTDRVDAVSSDLRAVVHDMDPRLPWQTIRRGDETYLRDARELRITAFSIAGLGLIALALAASGLYAVMHYVVHLRRHEIGVRIAVGAGPRQIVRMILRDALRLVLIGGLVGMGLVIPLAFGLRSEFAESVSVLDPMTLAPIFMLLFIVGLIAAALPARRAARTDPITTLRQD